MFFDFTKAFDSVPHEEILKALYTFQIDCLTIDIIKFLLNSYRTSLDG